MPDDAKSLDALMAGLADQHASDIADRIKQLEFPQIRAALRRLPDEVTAEVITELPEELQIQLFEAMRVTRLSGIIQEMFSDDVADVLGQVSTKRLEELLASLSDEHRKEIADLLRYPEDSAGGIMQTEFFAVREEMTLAEAREAIRRDEDKVGEGVFYIYAVDDIGRLRGVLKLRDLLFRRPEKKVREVMIPEVRCVSVHADQEAIANLFARYHFSAIPVIDDFGHLAGVVTGEDAMEVMQEEATEDMQRMVGLSGEEGIQTPWRLSLRNRLPWLFINLGTAFLAAWVVSLYETTIAQYAVLAIFLPIVAGQGGNAGTQTLTIVVRSLALGEVHIGDHGRILLKEFIVGLCAGIATGLAVGAISWLWKGDRIIGIVVCLAMIVNMCAAAVAGVVVPLGLKALKIDPALASAIMVTTVTDVVGFFIFLSLAAAALSMFPM